ncbi:hypothetical protein HZA75_02240 [Candidatus Roizmanbacteria bacterium]|nr:hypothetical protein [Candidatus Roizmanbacteria bacterium]
MVEFGGQAPSEALLIQLQGLREADGGKKAMEQYRLGDKEGQKLSQRDMDKLKEITTDENKDAAEIVRKQLESVNIYCEVANRIQAEGGQASRILTELKVIRSWDEIKTEALDILAETKVIRSIYKGINKNQRIRTIEEKITSDPRFREAFNQSAKDALARIDSLPKVIEPTDLKTKKEERDKLKETIQRQVDLIKSYTGLDETKIRELLELGVTDQRSVLKTLFDKALEKKGITGEEKRKVLEAMQLEVEYVKLENGIAELDEKIEQLQDDKKSAKSIKKKEERETRLSDLEEEFTSTKLKLERANKSRDSLKDKLTKLPNNVKQKTAAFKELYENVFGESLEGEKNRTGLVQASIESLLKEYPQFEVLERTIKSLESADVDYQKQLSQRNLAEADIIKQLETVFNDSIVDLFDKRFDEMTELDKKRLVKEQDEGLKKFDEWLEKRYVEFDTSSRREIHHRVATGDDMKLVAWYGNDGIKRIAAKQLGYGNDPNSWNEEQKTNIDKIFNSKGQDIKKKLFTSYFKEKIFLDRSFHLRIPFTKEILFDGGVGALSLTQAEWSRLGEHFGSEIEAGLASSKEAQNILKGLKEKGINPNWNMKWALWILIALGILTAIGVVTAIT